MRDLADAVALERHKATAKFSRKLTLALIAFDRKQEKLLGKNPYLCHDRYNLGRHLHRAINVVGDVNSGINLEQSLQDNFYGKVLTFLEKRFKLSVTRQEFVDNRKHYS